MSFLVTGASSGIGYAASCSLAARGHHVIAVARTLSLLETLKQKYLDNVHIVALDLSSESGRTELVRQITSNTTLEGIVHAAGSRITPSFYQELDIQHLLEDMNVHVMNPIDLNNQLQKQLIGGRVLYIDSYSAINPRVGWSGYSIVKAAAQMAARAAANEANGFRVVRVFPGAVKTPLVNNVLNSTQSSPTVEMFKKMNSSGEIADPELVGEFVANILLSATDSQLDEREYWDINSSQDQLFESVHTDSVN